MDRIVKYLIEKYNPVGIIVYGSFADESNNENSDYDALVIVDKNNSFRKHDNSIVDGVELDVFVYSKNLFLERNTWEDFRQLYDGKVVLDTDSIAGGIISAVRNYIEGRPKKTFEENKTNVEWCEKMLLRTQRNDTEGYFRWHWLLTDSLEIYYDLKGQVYFGPKKGIKKMEAEDKDGYSLYEKALRLMDKESLSQWVQYLKEQLK